MRNKELIDRRFMQIDGKIKNLKFLLSRPHTTSQDFMKELDDLSSVVEELQSLIERNQKLLN